MINRRQFGWVSQGQRQHFLPPAEGRQGMRECGTDRYAGVEKEKRTCSPIQFQTDAQVPCIPVSCNNIHSFIVYRELEGHFRDFFHLTNAVSVALDSDV